MHATEVFQIEHRANLVVIGLMGGIASGKSAVANMLKELGAHIVNADDIVHKVLEDPNIQKEIAASWGAHLLVGKAIDKKALAEIVFSSRENLVRLENILHPIVRRGIREKLQNLANKGEHIVVLDVALLWEGGMHQGCDFLIFVDTPFEIREKRAIQNRNWGAGEIEKREKFQADINGKRKAATFVVPNNGTTQETYNQICEIWKKINSYRKKIPSL